MSQVPRSIARRIDRLARHAHRFHRFAHHPLCDEYRGELVPLGRRARVCRGCSLVIAGACTGALVGSVWPAPAPWVSLGLWSLAIAGGARLTLDRRGAPRVRWPKSLSRFLPATLASFAVVSALRGGWAGLGLVVASGLAGVSVNAFYRRRGPDRGPCTSCPERDREVPCRGVMPIVRRERAFRRLAALWIARGS